MIRVKLANNEWMNGHNIGGNKSEVPAKFKSKELNGNLLESSAPISRIERCAATTHKIFFSPFSSKFSRLIFCCYNTVAVFVYLLIIVSA